MKEEYTEEHIEIKTIKINRKCSFCNEGHLLSTGKVSFSNPLKYSHKCSSCGEEEILTKKYPSIVQIEIPYKKILY
jgi:uncharacterized protein (DUF983 family)